jgi:hypothetical protein
VLEIAFQRVNPQDERAIYLCALFLLRENSTTRGHSRGGRKVKAEPDVVDLRRNVKEGEAKIFEEIAFSTLPTRALFLTGYHFLSRCMKLY